MFNQDEIKQLGAIINNADKDGFGLPTDGQGNVAIPQGSNFMAEVLKLDRKYFVLADARHPTLEQVFTIPNTVAMKAAGVGHVFTETNEMEARYLSEEMRARKNGKLVSDAQLENLLQGMENLQAQQIVAVPSDPREKYNSPEYDLKIKVANVREDLKALSLANAYLATVSKALRDVTTGEDFKKGLLVEFKNITQPEIDAIATVHNLVIKPLREKRDEALKLYGEKSEQYKEADEDFKGQAKAYQMLLFADEWKTPVDESELLQAKINLARFRLDAKNADVENFRSYLNLMEQLNSELEKTISESHTVNPKIVKILEAQSAEDKKTIVRFGWGHFLKYNDINEMLGTDKTIVIATVLDQAEMDTLLQQIRDGEITDSEEGKIEDKPDYVYMPERTTKDGEIIPEKIISVAEYLTAQQKSEQSKQPDTPQKQTGRQ